MDPRTRNPNSLRLLACLALLTACDLSVDASLIRTPDAGAELDGAVVEDVDAGEDDTDEPQQDAEAPQRDAEVRRDASVELDAQNPVPDASADAEWAGLYSDAQVDDAQERDVVVPIEPQVGCSRDSDCAADSFCTAAGACTARCDEQRGCAGPRVTRSFTGIAAVGDTVYWSTPGEKDTLGNPLNHGRIWSWRRTDPPTAIVQRDSGTLLFVIDDYIYLRRPAALGGEPTVLMRKWLGTPDSPAEQLATGVRKVWKTRDHVVWTHREAVDIDGSTYNELWRLRRLPASSPERALTFTGEGEWVASNATFAVRTDTWPPFDRYVIVRLSDQTLYGYVEQSGNENAVADEDYFYFLRNGVRRVPFSDLSQELILAHGMPGGMRWEPNGGWLYWYADIADSSGNKGGRTQRDALVPPQPLPSAPPYAAAFKNDLFYVDHTEERLFIETMPPLPCSSAMPCPEDMSCGASMFCE